MNTEYMYKVCIRCITYNHALYIEDALNGFAIQKITFPVVCCIIDDASTDGERDVLRRWAELKLTDDAKWQETPYGEIVEAPLKENPLLLFVIVLLSQNHYSIGEAGKKNEYIAKWIDNSKYVALCEGDDYWIQTEKLQKQVDYLESHSDVGMCYTNFNVLTEATGEMKESVLTTRPNEYSYDYTLGDWIRKKDKCYVGPMTWVLRKEFWKSLPSTQASVDGTFTTFTHLKYTSKTYCLLNETTAVYRINRGSMSQATNIEKSYWRIKGLYKQQILLAEKYLDSDKAYSIECINRVFYTHYFRLIYLLDNEEEMNKAKEYKNYLSKKDRVLMTLCVSPQLLSLYRKLYRKHFVKKNKFDK